MGKRIMFDVDHCSAHVTDMCSHAYSEVDRGVWRWIGRWDKNVDREVGRGVGRGVGREADRDG